MIVITEFMDDTAVETLRSQKEVIYDPTLADRQNELPEIAKSAEALIVRNRTQVSADLVRALPNLRCVGRLGVGLDNIDLEACDSAGVTVYPATGANTLSVAEYVITAAMVLLRQSWFLTNEMIDGGWPRTRAGQGGELSGKTLGLVGFGAIAQETCAKAEALGMRAIAFDPFLPESDPAWQHARSVSLDSVFAEADVVSLHVPLTEETRNLIDDAALETMRPGAVLINAARGGVVDEMALTAALQKGQIAGAALDVFDVEPLTSEAARKFRSAPNLILTPHIAGVTSEANTRVSKLTAQNVLSHLGNTA